MNNFQVQSCPISLFVTQEQFRVESCKHFTQNAKPHSFSSGVKKQRSDPGLGVKPPTVTGWWLLCEVRRLSLITGFPPNLTMAKWRCCPITVLTVLPEPGNPTAFQSISSGLGQHMEPISPQSSSLSGMFYFLTKWWWISHIGLTPLNSWRCCHKQNFSISYLSIHIAVQSWWQNAPGTMKQQ